MAGIVVGFGDTAVNTTDKNTWTHRTHILVEERDAKTDHRYIHVYAVCVREREVEGENKAGIEEWGLKF